MTPEQLEAEQAAIDAAETVVQQADKDVADAETAVSKAQAAHAAEVARLNTCRRDLGEVEAKILGSDPGDQAELLRLDGHRTALRIAGEVIERARLPKAEQAVAEAKEALGMAIGARVRAHSAKRTVEQPRLERWIEKSRAQNPLKPHYAGPTTVLHRWG